MENDKYLITFEYKKRNGCLVSLKTETKVLTQREIGELSSDYNYYERYIKIIFCQKL